MIGLQNTTSLRRLMMLGHLAGGIKTDEVTTFGNPITFQTDLARPLKSLEIPFSPRQSGSGDPSPLNIRPIVPWNGLTVGQINGTAPVISNNSGMENANGEWKNTGTDTKTRFDAYIQLYKNGTYIKNAGFKAIAEAGIYSMTFVVDDENCNRIILLHSGSQNNLSIRFPFNNAQGTYTINFNVVSANPSVVGGLAIKDIFLVAGSDVQRTETDISFPSPVYGGILDAVTGVLTVEWFCITPKWNEGTNTSVGTSYTRKSFRFPYPVRGVNGIYFNGQKCNMAKLAWDTSGSSHFYIDESTAYVWLPNETDENTEVQVLSKLVTPQEIQLTPQQITALVGNNTIWSDADHGMTAVYLKKR